MDEVTRIVGTTAEEYGYHRGDYSDEWIDGFETALESMARVLKADSAVLARFKEVGGNQASLRIDSTQLGTNQ